MYLVDLRGCVSSATDLSELTSVVANLCADAYEEMQTDESMWVFAPSEYRDSEYWPVGMAVADSIRNESPFILKNIISRYHEPDRATPLQNTYEDILFLVKDKKDYYFDKNAIRIDHVYKGNEWTKRYNGKSSYHDNLVRRYNPKGKDPGNVWLNEIRTESQNTTVDRTEPLPRMEAVLRCLQAGSKPGETIKLIGWDESIVNLVKQEDRIGQLLSINKNGRMQV